MHWALEECNLFMDMNRMILSPFGKKAFKYPINLFILHGFET